LIKETVIPGRVMVGLRSKRWMRKKSEWTQTIVGTDDDTQPGKSQAKWSQLAIAGGRLRMTGLFAFAENRVVHTSR
jgi:hypothetical protein